MADISVIFFAHLRETLGKAECSVELSELNTQDTVGLISYLTETLAGFQDYTESQAVLVAVNQTLVNSNTPIASGDEVALFPPVTGG